MEKNAWLKIRDRIETFLPMTLGSLVLFAIVIYLFVIVGRTVYQNYKSDKELNAQTSKLEQTKEDVHYLQNQINYYQTYSFREKEAREKLGYKAPGESVMALPIDTVDEQNADTGLASAKIKEPNYRLWWKYFLGE